jgi:MalT-like TPR region
MLAEAYREVDQLDEALNVVGEALAAADEQEERHYESEIHRLRGELLLKRDDSNGEEARSCFQRAIEIARMQSAKSWELRATTSLARLLTKQGNRDEARTMLAAIYGWFTEGFDTADTRQRLFIVPDRDLVVVTNAGLYQSDLRTSVPLEILDRYVLNQRPSSTRRSPSILNCSMLTLAVISCRHHFIDYPRRRPFFPASDRAGETRNVPDGDRDYFLKVDALR